MIKKKLATFAIGLMAMAVVLFAHNSAYAIVSTFTNQAAWEAALSGATFLTETFDGSATTFPADSTGNPAGLVTVDVDGDPGSNPVGLTGTGFFQGYVEEDPNSSDSVDLEFRRPNMIGVAFLGLTIHPGQNQLDLQEIGFDFGTGDVPGFEFLACEVLALCTPGPGDFVDDIFADGGIVEFVGFVFDGPRNGFGLDHGNSIRDLLVNGDDEPFLLDTLIIAEASAVPEPGALSLFGLGLFGLALTRRRKRQRAITA